MKLRIGSAWSATWLISILGAPMGWFVASCAAEIPHSSRDVTSQIDRNTPGDFQRALAATVSVKAPGCGQLDRRGLGVALANGLVLTAAHVVMGSRQLSVSSDSNLVGLAQSNPGKAAQLVFLDSAADLALLKVPPFPETSVLRLRVNHDRHNSSVLAGSKAVVVLARRGKLVPIETEIIRTVQISTKDAFGKRKVKRLGYEIRATVTRGDSGSPVVLNGEVVGSLWSRSQLRTDRAWVTDTGGIEQLMKRNEPLAVPGATGCL
jgi:Trypsin-like peptidase domain